MAMAKASSGSARQTQRHWWQCSATGYQSNFCSPMPRGERIRTQYQQRSGQNHRFQHWSGQHQMYGQHRTAHLARSGQQQRGVQQQQQKVANSKEAGSNGATLPFGAETAKVAIRAESPHSKIDGCHCGMDKSSSSSYIDGQGTPTCLAKILHTSSMHTTRTRNL